MEGNGGTVVGVVIRLSATISPKGFSGLIILREHLGEKFVRGVLIYTGREVVPFGENLPAVPISVLSHSSANKQRDPLGG
jgi:uncharacterized protein